MIAEKVIFVLEAVGTVAFAVSGSLLAIEKKLDMLGIAVLAVTTAVGGGVLRDLLLGNTPPAMFQNPVYVIVALLTACVPMILVLQKGGSTQGADFFAWKNIMGLINVFDAVGLGVFTIVGMNTAMDCGYIENGFLTVFVGVMTGVGGGMIRDVLVQATPLVLRREIYATAAIIGAVVYYMMLAVFPNAAAMVAGILAVIIVRLTAVWKNWHLPAAAEIKP